VPETLLASGIVLPAGVETKADRSQQASVRPGLSGWQVESKLRDYTSYLEAVRRIPYLNACVSVKALNFAATVGHLMDGEDILANEEDHEFQQLMARPNPFMSRAQFLELLTAYLELTGNAYLTLEDRDGYGRPRELYLPNPARMRVIPDPERMVAGYVYDAGGMSRGQQLVPYQPDEVIHLKYPNPLDPYYGMGNVEAMQELLDTVLAMQTHEQSYWASGGRIIGVLETESKLSDNDFRNLTEHWRLASADQKSRVRVAILEQGLKYTPIAEGLRSLDLVNISKEKRDAVLAVFGVPKAKLGIMEDANYKAVEADQFFWQETMTPLHRRFEDAIQPLVDLYDPGLRYEFERRNFEDDTAKLQNATLMKNLACFTANELRVYVGVEELGPEGDFIWSSAKEVPIALDSLQAYSESVGTPIPETPPPASPSVDTAEDNVIPLPRLADNLKAYSPEELAQRRESGKRRVQIEMARTSPRGPFQRVSLHTKKLASGGRLPHPPDRTSLRQPVVAEAMKRQRLLWMRQQVPESVNALRQAFKEQRKAMTRPAVLNRLAKLNVNREPADTYAERLKTKLRDTLKQLWPSQPLHDALHPLLNGAELGYQAAARMLPGKSIQSPERKALGDRINRDWQAIDDTTFEAVVDQLATGIQRGYTPLQIAQGYADEDYEGIQGVFEQASDYRAEMIARTETAQAWNEGAIAAYGDAGVSQVEISDGTAYDSLCADRDGSVVDIDEIDGLETHPNDTISFLPIASSIQPDLTDEGDQEE